MSKKRSKVLHLCESDKLLVGLQDIVNSGSPRSDKASSFISWWFVNKSWTKAQWEYIRHLIHDHKKKKTLKLKDCKYHIYAISDGSALKIGFSSDITKRCKTMQTSHPKKLKVVWKYYVGRDRKEAAKVESAVHRYCKKERIRGEWFTMDARKKLENFTIKRTTSNDQEMTIVLEAMERI